MSPRRPGRAAVDIPAALERAAAAVSEGRPLGGTGFWKAVDHARRDRAVAEDFAERIAAIDRRSFESQVRLRAPVWAGNLALMAGTGVGVAAIALAPRFSSLARSLVFLGGFGALAVSTHSLTHWVVGRAMGIRFTHYSPSSPCPCCRASPAGWWECSWWPAPARSPRTSPSPPRRRTGRRSAGSCGRQRPTPSEGRRPRSDTRNSRAAGGHGEGRPLYVVSSGSPFTYNTRFRCPAEATDSNCGCLTAPGAARQPNMRRDPPTRYEGDHRTW